MDESLLYPYLLGDRSRRTLPVWLEMHQAGLGPGTCLLLPDL